MRDRRKAQRWSTNIGGRALFLSNVMIRDLSLAGAKLCTPNDCFIPDSFDLTVPKLQATYHVYVCWRHSDEIGVVFEQDCTKEMPLLLSLARHDKQLAAKVGELERKIAG
jgi:hypothetical protein